MFFYALSDLFSSQKQPLGNVKKNRCSEKLFSKNIVVKSFYPRGFFIKIPKFQ